MNESMKMEPAANLSSISLGTVGTVCKSISCLDSSSFEQESDRFVGFIITIKYYYLL